MSDPDPFSSDSLFQSAFQFAAIGMALVSPEGKWLRVNRSLCEITGYSEAELMERTFQDITHPDDLEADLANVRKMLAGKINTYQMKKRYFHKNGSVVWILLSVSLMRTKSGDPLYFISQIQDITDLLRAEAEVQQRREDLSHLSRLVLVGEMSAAIAHELNQPLSAIASNASAARRFIEHGNADRASMLEILSDIAADSERAGKVIHSIRNLLHKRQGARMPVNLNSMVTDTVRLASMDAILREGVLTTELDPQLPQIHAAPVQIQQVLLNLIANAFEAMDALPRSERRIIISTNSDEGKMAEVSVRDFGVGLPKDSANKVFERFFSTKRDGMGMGLSIVRSIVEAHGGTILAENLPDRGARMVVRLPAARVETPSESTGAKLVTKMKLPRDVFFHHDLRLMIFRPRGALNEKRVDEIVDFLGKEESRADKPFNRFSDLSKLAAIHLDFPYIFRVSLHRLLSYARHAPVKSAFYVTSEEAAQIVNIHAIMTDYSPLQVAMFKDLEAAAKWLGVSVEDLELGE